MGADQLALCAFDSIAVFHPLFERFGFLLPSSLLQNRMMLAYRQRAVLSVEIVLIRNGLATEQQVAESYSQYLVIPPFIRPDGVEIDTSLGSLLPEKLCRERLLAPVAVRDEILDVAFFSAADLLMIDELQLLTGMSVNPLIASLSAVEATIDALYSVKGRAADIGSSPSDDYSQAEEEDTKADHDDDILDLDKPPPPGQDGNIIRLVNQILEQALRISASDIHIEPFEDSCAIRLRVDGVLRELAPPPRSLFVPIVSRFKILAKMDIAEKRVPQDGAISLKSGEKRVDLRVSTVPTVYGEKMVMRSLDKGAIPIELTGLGFDERQSKDLIESIQMPNGLMLVTGPTGSGKSTTLYACLNLLNEPDTNICTVEDPVEYRFKGMNQVQVKTQVGLTFAGALRLFAARPGRHHGGRGPRPGNGRDLPSRRADGPLRSLDDSHERFALGRQSSGGHGHRAVLVGLHASGARSATVDPPPVQGVQGRIRMRPGNGETTQLGTRPEIIQPKGCDYCRGTGYKGRVGVFEVIRITSKMGNLIQTRAPLPELRVAPANKA